MTANIWVVLLSVVWLTAACSSPRLPEEWKFVALGVPIPSQSGYGPSSTYPTKAQAKDACDKAVGRPEAHPVQGKRSALVREYVECMKNYGWAPA